MAKSIKIFLSHSVSSTPSMLLNYFFWNFYLFLSLYTTLFLSISKSTLTRISLVSIAFFNSFLLYTIVSKICSIVIVSFCGISRSTEFCLRFRSAVYTFIYSPGLINVYHGFRVTYKFMYVFSQILNTFPVLGAIFFFIWYY